MTYEFYRSVNLKPFIKKVERGYSKQGTIIRYTRKNWLVWHNDELYLITQETYGCVIHVYNFDSDSGVLYTDNVFDTISDANDHIIFMECES